MKNEDIEEVLEIIWTCEEKGIAGKEGIFRELAKLPSYEKLYHELLKKGLVEEKEDKVLLTKEGNERARMMVRQHRLAEVLMSNVLGIDGEEMEKSACAFEHSLVPEITEGICVLLGHPTVCPHGSPIPPGDCCSHKNKSMVHEAIVPLTEIKAGHEVRVSYLNSSQERRLHYLSSIGVNPGTMIRVHQTYPSIVVECGNTQIAMEEKIANDIYVWKEKE